MIYADSIIENNSLFLRNLNINNENTEAGRWSTASSSYGFYGMTYEQPLSPNHIYYGGYTYKFTTTNQSPTWVYFYFQGGSNTLSGTRISNPVAGTEYTITGCGRPGFTSAGIPLKNGTLYNGESNAISGVKAQAKDVFLYDVTELYECLRAAGIATTEAQLKTWCDEHLEYRPRYQNYDIRALVVTETTKVMIHKGTILANEYIEPDGMQYYSVSTSLRDNTYFDSGSGVSIYNNSGGGTVTHARVSSTEQNSPFGPEHPYVLKITTNGTASPGAGGFIASHMAAANKIFVEKFIAKVPVGYTVYAAYNSQGTGNSVTWLSSQAGTGDWAEYTILYKCGSSGSFSSGGHVYISGSNNTSVTWYLAYVNNCDITSNENLKFYTVLPCKNIIKNGIIYSRELDCCNLIPNGILAKQETAMLPNSSWYYDTTDYAGASTCSIVQPVGAAAGIFGAKMKAIPGQRYKLSYWVKCKGDMSSFLTAIMVYISNGTALNLTNVVYKVGAKTQLTQELKDGDTSMKVKSNANWGSRSYSKVGFRSNNAKSYNDIGVSNANGSTGLISGITGTDTVNFNIAYTGATRAVNTYVVESYDGANYPYPIRKDQLPTDNTWKYVEGYFGAQVNNVNTIWDGASNSEWINLPGECTHIGLYLNLYSNNGTVPIKFSDIRIEPVSQSAGQRQEQKIQIIGGD